MGQLIAEYTNQTPQDKISYLTTDHLGSPRIVTDQNGTILSRHDYLAFGDEVSITVGNVGGRTTEYGADDKIRQQYTGYERDTESGLDYAQARYYNSQHGRYTSIDPLTASASIRDPQTFNRYSYVLNSPYKFTDPLGLFPVFAGSACGEWCGSSMYGSGCSSNYSGEKEEENNDSAQNAQPADDPPWMRSYKIAPIPLPKTNPEGGRGGNGGPIIIPDNNDPKLFTGTVAPVNNDDFRLFTNKNYGDFFASGNGILLDITLINTEIQNPVQGEYNITNGIDSIDAETLDNAKQGGGVVPISEGGILNDVPICAIDCSLTKNGNTGTDYVASQDLESSFTRTLTSEIIVNTNQYSGWLKVSITTTITKTKGQVGVTVSKPTVNITDNGPPQPRRQ